MACARVTDCGADETPSLTCLLYTSGMELAAQARQDGIRLLGVGEMGIGNTTTSSAVPVSYTHLMLPRPPSPSFRCPTMK